MARPWSARCRVHRGEWRGSGGQDEGLGKPPGQLTSLPQKFPARELPPGQDHHNALREIGRFRAQIATLQGADLPPAQLGLKAKGK